MDYQYVNGALKIRRLFENADVTLDWLCLVVWPCLYKVAVALAI
jgi:hypothetical protein